MARNFIPLLYAMLALAAQQESSLLRGIAENTQSENWASLAVESIGSDIYSNRDEAVATCTLQMLYRLLSTQLHDWRHLLKDRIQFLRQLGINTSSDGHQGSTSWLILRLGKYLYSPLYYSHPLFVIG